MEHEATSGKKRVLQVFPYYFPPDIPDNGGGVKRAAITLLSGLMDSAFDTYVLVPKRNPLYDQAFLRAGAKGVFDLDDGEHLVLEFSRFREKAYLLQYCRRLLRSVIKIRRIISQLDIDLVHSHGSSFLGGAIAAKMSSVPSVVHVHEYGFRLSSIANRFYYSIVPRLADRIATCAEFITQGFINNGTAASLVSTIYNGVDLEYFSSGSIERSGSFRSEINVGPSDFIVGFVGRFTSRKGVGVFVESALHILKQRSEVVFVVVGGADEHVREEREYREAVISQVGESGFAAKFCFVGGREDMPAVYDAFDLLIFCSPQDMGPLVPLESMAMGTPVVVASEGGAMEEVSDTVTGIVVESREVEDIAAAVLRLIDDRPRVEAMSEQTREHVENFFSRDRYVAEFLKVYDTLLS